MGLSIKEGSAAQSIVIVPVYHGDMYPTWEKLVTVTKSSLQVTRGQQSLTAQGDNI